MCEHLRFCIFGNSGVRSFRIIFWAPGQYTTRGIDSSFTMVSFSSKNYRKAVFLSVLLIMMMTLAEGCGLKGESSSKKSSDDSPHANPGRAKGLGAIWGMTILGISRNPSLKDELLKTAYLGSVFVDPTIAEDEFIEALYTGAIPISAPGYRRNLRKKENSAKGSRSMKGTNPDTLGGMSPTLLDIVTLEA